MAEIIDLALHAEAQRLLRQLLDRHGIRFFLATEGRALMALEKSKIDLVVHTAMGARERLPGEIVEAAVEHCRRQVRRSLIREVARAMVQSGC